MRPSHIPGPASNKSRLGRLPRAEPLEGSGWRLDLARGGPLGKHLSGNLRSGREQRLEGSWPLGLRADGRGRGQARLNSAHGHTGKSHLSGHGSLTAATRCFCSQGAQPSSRHPGAKSWASGYSRGSQSPASSTHPECTHTHTHTHTHRCSHHQDQHGEGRPKEHGVGGGHGFNCVPHPPGPRGTSEHSLTRRRCHCRRDEFR